MSNKLIFAVTGALFATLAFTAPASALTMKECSVKYKAAKADGSAKDVKWNDGKPFSAQDVAFTFNLMKKFPAIDLYSLWTGAGMQSVTAAGDKVTMTFAQSAQPYFYYFANQVGIVPQHVFGSGAAASHPDTFADKAPVGSISMERLIELGRKA